MDSGRLDSAAGLWIRPISSRVDSRFRYSEARAAVWAKPLTLVPSRSPAIWPTLVCFVSPSLRNVGVSGPYMHDGRFVSLEAVVDHYNNGVQAHENLSLELRGPGVPLRLGFGEADKAALVAFLHTLTDQTFLTDERFSEPIRDSS